MRSVCETFQNLFFASYLQQYHIHLNSHTDAE